jgi:trigger factor
MKIDVDEVSPVQRKVRVEVPAENVANEFDHVYKDLGKRVRIKGFRTGKIPRSVLQGIYGDEVKGEVKSHLVEESLAEVLKERSLQIVSRPEVETNDLREGDPFSFSALFEIKPQIEAKDYFGVEVEKPKLTVSEEQVESALKRLQEAHARLELVEGREVVQNGDFVTLDFDGSIGGKAFSGGKGENYMLEVGSGHALPQFEQAVIGLKIGDRQTVQVNYPESYPNKEIAAKNVDFSIVVREIKQKVLPILDDEFAKDHGEHGSLVELREAIRKRLEDELEHYQQENLKEQLVARLIDGYAFGLPSSMVERQTRYLMERYQSQMAGQPSADAEAAPALEEVRKNLEDRATRQVRATLLVEKIAQQENVTISDGDLQAHIENLARASGERAKNVREYYAKPDAREDLRAQMVFDRTVGYLLERARIKEVDSTVSKVDDTVENR